MVNVGAGRHGIEGAERMGEERNEMWKNIFPAASKHNIYSTQNKVGKIMTFLSGQLSQI